MGAPVEFMTRAGRSYYPGDIDFASVSLGYLLGIYITHPRIQGYPKPRKRGKRRVFAEGFQGVECVFSAARGLPSTYPVMSASMSSWVSWPLPPESNKSKAARKVSLHAAFTRSSGPGTHPQNHHEQRNTVD